MAPKGMDASEGLRALTAGLNDVVERLDALVFNEAADGDSEPWTTLRGSRAMTAKHLALSVRSGRLVTFQLPDQDDITGYVSGWDDLRASLPFIFVITFHPDGFDRTLVPLSESTVIRLHDKSTSPKESADPHFNHYQKVVQPFRSYVTKNFFPPRQDSQDAAPVNTR